MFNQKIESVALFEPVGHHEVLEIFLLHFQHFAGKMDVLTKEENLHYLNENILSLPHCNWQTFNSRKKDKDLINEWLKNQINVDLFIWITLPPEWYGFKMEYLPKNSVLIIHNQYFWFAFDDFKSSLFCHHKSFYHHVKYYFFLKPKQERWLLKFKEYDILTHYRYLISERKIQQTKIWHPFSIVVPGKITQNGRDYELIRSFIHKLPTHLFLEIVFLGDASSTYARRFLKSIEMHSFPNIKIVSFDKYVPGLIFENHLKLANIIWIPLKPFRYYGGVFEKVGYSTITGGVFDIWKFQKTGWMPYWYPLPDALKNLVIPYKSLNDLIDQLLEFLPDEEKIDTIGVGLIT